MNKVKKKEARKLREANETMSAEEFQAFMHKQQVQELAEQIHFEMFPEEYDFMMDSNADVRDRRRGISPMRTEYTERANARRKELGVPSLGPNGMAACQNSSKVAHAKAVLLLTSIT